MSFNPVALAVLRKRIDDAFDHVDNFQTMFCEFTHTGRKLANWNTNDAMIFLARVSCFKKNEPVNFCANAEFFFTFEKFIRLSFSEDDTSAEKKRVDKFYRIIFRIGI